MIESDPRAEFASLRYGILGAANIARLGANYKNRAPAQASTANGDELLDAMIAGFTAAQRDALVIRIQALGT